MGYHTLETIRWDDKKIDDIEDDSIVRLLDVLSSSYLKRDRVIAFNSLIKLGREKIAPHLEKTLSKHFNGNPNPQLLLLLKHINKYRDILLYFQLKDADFNKRAIAVEKIGELALYHYLPETVKLIEDNDPSVRYAVCRVINKMVKEGIATLDSNFVKEIYFRLENRFYKENNTTIKNYIRKLIADIK